MTDYEKERFAWVEELTTEEKWQLLEFIMELPSQRGRELEDDRKNVSNLDTLTGRKNGHL